MFQQYNVTINLIEQTDKITFIIIKCKFRVMKSKPVQYRGVCVLISRNIPTRIYGFARNVHANIENVYIDLMSSTAANGRWSRKQYRNNHVARAPKSCSNTFPA